MTGFAKVFGAAALVVTVTVAVVYGLALSGLRERDAANVTAQLQTEAQLAAAALRPAMLGPALAADHPAQLAAELARLSGLLPGRRLTALAADGRALADTHEAAESLGNLLERPEVRAARGLEARPGAARNSRLSESPQRAEAAAIRDGERLLGFVVLSLSEADRQSEEQLLHEAILQAAILALLTGAIAAALLARSVQRPIRELSDDVEAIARGESPPRLLDEGHGELAELRVALHDMSTRLGARFQRIARDESEIRAIVGSMEEGVLAVDGELRAVLVNAAAGRLLGFDAARAQGRLVWELTRLPQVAGLLERCLRDQRATVGETLLAGEPHDRVLGLTATPLGSAEAGSGQAWGCVLVLRDLTEVRRLEQVRRDFVVNVSHELKTPLTSLRGFLDAVLDDPAMDAGTRQHFLERARVNNERMIAIVGDLLSLARVEAETGVPRAEALDLRDLAREARGALLSLAAEREMQILLELPAQPVPVRGDRIGLLTALTNLLDNALKYGPRGSPVRLAVSGQGGDAVVEVSDQGPGIPPHETERIFERFYRLDKNRSRDLGGTGLGLSIVRHVAASHGGRVFVLSSVGHGSTFRLAIPLQEDGRAGLSSEPAGAGPARSDAGSRPT